MNFIAQDEIGVWTARPDQVPRSQLDRFRGVLSPRETERLEGFRFEQDARQYLVAHGMLRSVLARCTGQDPGEIGFRSGRWGKPWIEGGDGGIRFNLTHTRGLVACAVALRREVGIDAEYPDSHLDLAIAGEVLAEREYREVMSISSGSERESRFLQYWTLKEAYLKGRGAGLSVDLPSFSFQIGEEIEFLPPPGDRREDWGFVLVGGHGDPGIPLALAWRKLRREESPTIRIRSLGDSGEWDGPAGEFAPMGNYPDWYS